MELTFEQTTNLGAGDNPAAIHLNTGEVYLFAVEEGRLKAKLWNPGTGDVPWNMPDFGVSAIATADKALSLYRIKNVPRVGMFGAWHQDTVMRGDKIITPERQRIGTWDALNDITKYLESGSIQLDLDNIVSAASFTFKNPSNWLSGESASRLTPGKKIELFFSAGDSDDYPMGVFYVDRVTMETHGETATVECRNISGKLLKDQMLNAHYNYPKDVYAYVVEDFLTKAGVTNYDIQQPPDPLTAWQLGMTFPVDMDRLTALNELIRSSLNWVVRETLDGQIVAGSDVSYQPIIDMVGKYQFDRSDLISRRVERDDADVYSTVCYQAKDTSTGTTIRKYVAVTHALEWSIAPHKTLYITAPDDTPEAELEDLAENLADRMGQVGVLETFEGPFRPHLVPGDEAEITSPESRLLGVIATVKHRFGDDGFFTEFTVDSGGVKGKPMLKDLINKVNETRPDNIKRII